MQILLSETFVRPGTLPSAAFVLNSYYGRKLYITSNVTQSLRESYCVRFGASSAVFMKTKASEV
jgi:hypothetical protein